MIDITLAMLEYGKTSVLGGQMDLENFSLIFQESGASFQAVFNLNEYLLSENLHY